MSRSEQQELRTLIEEHFGLTAPDENSSMPSWLLVTGVIVGLIVVLLAAFSLVMLRRAAAATRELRRVNGNLERAVAERTTALRNSNGALRRFATTAAHDLRGPITAISGNAEMLASGIVPEEHQADMLGRVESSAARLVTMIDAMLTDAMRLGVTTDSLDGDSFSSWLSEVIGPELHAVDADLLIDVPSGSLDIDSEVLRRTALNLVENAVKYATNAQGPTIAVTLRRTDDSWQLTVADNGPGIPQPMWSKIFDRGTRLVRDDRGFGLGLAAIRDLVQNTGGAISVGHAELGGALFAVTLPHRELAVADVPSADQLADARPG